MKQYLFLIGIFSHLLCDFVCQSPAMINNRFPNQQQSTKYKQIFIGNLIHASCHGVGYIGLLFTTQFLFKLQVIEFKMVLCISLAVMVGHFIIDLIKSLLAVRFPSLKMSLMLFSLDQVAHLVYLYGIICYIFSFNFNSFGHDPWLDKVILSGCIIITVTYVAAIFIRLVLNKLDYLGDEVSETTPNIGGEMEETGGIDASNQVRAEQVNGPTSCVTVSRDETDPFVIILNMRESHHQTTTCDVVEKGAQNAGKIIGVLERLLIMIFVFVNQYPVIIALLTFKTIVRLNKFKQDKFVEYFVVGTLLSCLIAILSGICLTMVWK